MLIKDSDSAWLFIKKSAKNLYGHCRLGHTTSYGPVYTGTRHQPQPTDTRRPVRCVCCKRQHPSSSCDVVANPQDRLSIVKRDNLCFNCLAHHKVTQCNSKFRCRACKCKHHTSLCTTPTQPTTDPTKKDGDDSKKTLVTYSSKLQRLPTSSTNNFMSTKDSHRHN